MIRRIGVVLGLFLALAVGARGQTVISNVYVSSTTNTTATIVWTTSTPATSQIRYGFDNTLPFSNNRNFSLVTSHSMTLTVLNASQPYFFAVVSVDAGNHTTQSSTFQFALCGGSGQEVVPPSFGTVPVTGTVNFAYGNGSYSITWNPPSGAVGTPTVCGHPVATTVTGTLNTSGSFNSQVADALKVTPGPGTWTVHVADPGNIAAISTTQALSVANQDVSAPLQAAAVSPGLVQVTATSTQCFPAFVCAGGGGGGVNPGANYALPQYSLSTGSVVGPSNLFLDTLSGNNLIVGLGSLGSVTSARIGGLTYAKQFQTGSGFNGILNAVTNGATEVADPSYVITATANMTKGSNTFTVSGVTGGVILPGMFVAGNLAYAVVSTVVGSTITLSNGTALTTNAAVPVWFYEMPFNNLNANNVLPNASMFNFKDQFLGSEVSIKINPPVNVFTSHEDFNLETCYELHHSSWVLGGGTSPAGTNQACHYQFAWYAAPSTNYGTTASGHGPSNWGITLTNSLSDLNSNMGIGELMGGVHAKAGIGDGPLSYFYYADYLGAVTGADEGQGGPFYAGGEANTTYIGTVSTGGGGTGATQLSVTCTSDCFAVPGVSSGGPGQGRYMVDKTNPISFDMLSRIAPSGQIPGLIVTDSTTLPVSTFWGTLSGDVLTPPALNANGIPFADQNPATTMTFTVAAGTLNSIASPGPPAIGDLVCFSWPTHEQAKITNVTGSGPWSVTAALRMNHTNGSWMFSNGTCGYYIDFTANDVAASGTSPAVTLHYPFESLGSISTSTMAYVFFSVNAVNGGAPNAFPIGNIQFPVGGGPAVNVGGIVTFTNVTTSGGSPFLFGQSTLSITNAANALYNGTCTNSAANSFGQLTCYQAASLNQPSTTGTFLSVGSSGLGNVQGVLWQGAEVLNILDYNQTNCAATAAKNAPCFDNKNITLEPNTAAWSNADAVEEPHHYASSIKASKQLLADYDNYQLQPVDGWVYSIGGPGVCCGAVTNPALNRAQLQLLDTTVQANYQGHGGTTAPMGGIIIGGQSSASVGRSYAIDMNPAPEPNGIGRVIYVDCPSSPYLCTDRQYRYKIVELNNSTTTNSAISFVPFTGDIIFGDGTNPILWNSPNNDMNFLQMRDNMKFAPLATPVIVASLPTSSTNGNIPDTTTRYFTVTAKDNAGSSLASAEVSKTTGSTGSNTNSITVQWGRVTGATTYQVCEGPTPGSEQLRATISNVGGNIDSTFYLETLAADASGGVCLNAATQPGPDQAGYIKLLSTSTANIEATILPGAFTSNYTLNLPETNAAGALVDKATGATVIGHIATFSNTTGRIQDSGVAIPSVPTKITNSITPAAATASSCVEQTFTYTGLATTQQVGVSPPASLGVHIWIGWARASATNTLAIGFCGDATAGTPPSGNYIAVAF